MESKTKNWWYIMIGRILASLVIIGSASWPALAGESSDAHAAQAVIEGVATRVTAAIKAEQDTLAQDPDRIYSLVNKEIIPHFDFATMSKWVLGKQNWQQATPTQQEQFIEQFSILLSHTYSRVLLEYSDQKVNYLGAELGAKPNLATVKSEIETGDAQTINVNYRMYKMSESWKVIDVSIDGVSLASTYRASFGTEIKNNGFAEFISALTIRNNEKIKR